MSDNVRTPFTRLWTIEDRASPANSPVYQGFGRPMSPSQDFGDVTPIREPDPNRYGAFQVVDQIRGEPGLPEMGMEVRHQFTLSEMLRIARKGCPLDIQVHYGKCQDPRNFNAGWDKILVIEGSVITNWSADDLGALNQGDDSVVNESVDTTGIDMYEVKKLAIGELAAAIVTREIVDVAICDSVTCGACGLPSDGCQIVFALSLSVGGSPGLPADVLYSRNGGTTVTETNVDTLGANENPNGLACVGTYLVVISEVDEALHYAPIADILNGTETWVRVATGFVPTKGPLAIFSLNSVMTWIAGEGGYVYFNDDITSAVEVQNAGAATVQNLNAIHGADELNLVAVGASNAVIMTTNGGVSWSSITGPSVGVILNTVFMKSATEWFIGTAGGKLFYTRDSGDTWTEKTFPGSGAGIVNDVVFATPTVGYMAHDTATPVGRVLRSVDGGNSWYVLPEEGGGVFPDNDSINAIAACGENVNIMYAGGLGANATDGIYLKGA